MLAIIFIILIGLMVGSAIGKSRSKRRNVTVIIRNDNHQGDRK